MIQYWSKQLKQAETADTGQNDPVFKMVCFRSKCTLVVWMINSSWYIIYYFDCDGPQ